MLSLTPDAAQYIGDFGETLALIPAIVAVWIFMVFAGARRLAGVWAATLLLAIAITALVKLAAGPVSGHTAISTGFYGGLAIVMWQARPSPSWPLRFAALALVCLVGLVAWCVCIVGWHSPEDAVGGVLVGGICPIALGYALQTVKLSRLGAASLLVIAILLVMPLHGSEFKYPELTSRSMVLAALAKI